MRKDRDREAVEFMINRLGYSPAEATAENKLIKKNAFIRRAKIAAIGACAVASLICAGPRYAHILQDIGFDTLADITKNNQVTQFMHNYAKGAFQVAMAGQIVNLIVADRAQAKERNRIFKETGLKRAQPLKDFSLFATTSLFTLNFVWELSDILFKHQSGLDVFDTMIPAATLGLMYVFNKAVHKIADMRFDKPKAAAPVAQPKRAAALSF